MPVKLAVDKAAPLQTTLQALLWLGALAASAVIAALLIVTVFGTH